MEGYTDAGVNVKQACSVWWMTNQTKQALTVSWPQLNPDSYLISVTAPSPLSPVINNRNHSDTVIHSQGSLISDLLIQRNFQINQALWNISAFPANQGTDYYDCEVSSNRPSSKRQSSLTLAKRQVRIQDGGTLKRLSRWCQKVY